MLEKMKSGRRSRNFLAFLELIGARGESVYSSYGTFCQSSEWMENSR